MTSVRTHAPRVKHVLRALERRGWSRGVPPWMTFSQVEIDREAYSRKWCIVCGNRAQKFVAVFKLPCHYKAITCCRRCGRQEEC